MLRPYKFHVYGTVQEVNKDGTVTGERIVANGQEPVVLFGVQALKDWADSFEGQLASVPES